MSASQGNTAGPECEEHPGAPAVARCVSCGKLLCSQCMVERDRMYCSTCAPPLWKAGPAVPRPAPAIEQPLQGGLSGEPPAVPPPRDASTPGGSVGIQLDIARAFGYMIDDPAWVGKFLVGVLCCLGSVLVVPLFILLGYQVELVRRIAAGEDRTLPEWDDIGRKLKEGAELFVASLVYAAPYLLALALVLLLGLLISGDMGTGVYALARVVAVLLFALGWLVLLVAGLGLRLIMPAIAGTYSMTLSVRDTIRFKWLLGIVRYDLKRYLLVLLFTWIVAGFIISMGVILCCVGVFFAWFYVVLVNSHLYGQLARSNPEFPGVRRSDG